VMMKARSSSNNVVMMRGCLGGNKASICLCGLGEQGGQGLGGCDLG